MLEPCALGAIKAADGLAAAPMYSAIRTVNESTLLLAWTAVVRDHEPILTA